MKKDMRAFVTALQFLTRLPTPDLGPPTEEDLRRSYVFYPVVGLLLGCLLATVALFAHILFASRLLVAVIVVAMDVYLTGGLHMDGLMDTADGLLSYRSRDRMLEIMKDSRVGAMAVLVVLFVTLLRIGALAVLPISLLARVVFAGAFFSRGLLLLTIRYTTPAKAEGLGRQATVRSGGAAMWALALTAALCGAVLLGTQGIVAMIVSVLLLSRFATGCRRRLGGMTGDTYGASIELTQCALSLVMALRPS